MCGSCVYCVCNHLDLHVLTHSFPTRRASDLFSEVFFEDVKVEARYLLGEQNQGWRIAMAAASFERGTYFLPRLVRFQQELNNIKKWVGKNDEGTDSAVAARQRWARLAVDSHVLKLKSQRALTEIGRATV